MTTVWILDDNVTDFNYLVSRDQTSPPPRLGEGRSQLETWEQPEVWYHPLDFRKDLGMANFPSWSAVTVVCDLEAKQIISDLLENHVEFLPLASPTVTNTEYFAINVLQILDCLDYEGCEFTRFKSTGGIRSVRKFEFKRDRIGGIPIFKLPILRSISTYVNDEFKQLVEDNNLTGLEFRKVWEG